MCSTAERVLEELCSADLTRLDPAALQDLAVLLRGWSGRLAGRADQVLAELDARLDGKVPTPPKVDPTRQESPVGSPAVPDYRPIQAWWRDTVTVSGSQAGREVRSPACCAGCR